MATKVIKLVGDIPKRFGPQRAKKPRGDESPKNQLDLFSAGKVIPLHKISPYEEGISWDELGEKEKARKAYLHAIQDNDNLADAYCNLGIIEYEDKDFSSAVGSFTNSLKADPRHIESHYNLANLYAEMGNVELSRFHYQIALKISPSFSNCLFNYALLLLKQQEFKEATLVLERLQIISSENEISSDNALIKSILSIIK